MLGTQAIHMSPTSVSLVAFGCASGGALVGMFLQLVLPERPPATGYARPPRDLQSYVPDHAATLMWEG